MSEEKEHQEEPREFHVPETAISWLDKKFARMAKVAKEVGAPPPVYKVLREEFKPHMEWSEIHAKEIQTGVDKFVVITVEGEPPKLAGWRFVARLTPTEHLTKEGVSQAPNLISTIPGTEDPVPEEYRTISPGCDYCNKSRRRIDSFIVRSETTGEYRQIGRNCLAKFLGFSDPERVARYASWWADLEQSISEGTEEFLRAGRPAEYIDLVDFMAMVVAVTDAKGWVTQKQAVESGRPPSVLHVLDQMNDTWRQQMKKDWRHRDELLTPTEDQKRQAREVITWARSDSLLPDTDYKHNLKISTASEAFHQKAVGIVASLVNFKRRCEESDRERAERQRKREEEREKMISSEFIGKEGERIVIPYVQLIRRRELHGQYGRSDVCRMKDEHGNIIVWFAAGGSDMEEGKEYSLTCTVKRHEVYEDIKQTIVTRCIVGQAGVISASTKKHGRSIGRKGPGVEPSLSGVSGG